MNLQVPFTASKKLDITDTIIDTKKIHFIFLGSFTMRLSLRASYVRIQAMIYFITSFLLVLLR